MSIAALILLVASAGALPQGYENVGPLGWTADGRHLTYTVGEGPTIHALDVWTGVVATELADEAAFEAWTRAHATVPGGKGASAQGMDLVITCSEGAWREGSYYVDGASTFTGGDEPAPKVKDATVTIDVRKKGRKHRVRKMTVSRTNVGRWLLPLWSPDGKRVAIIDRTTSMNEGEIANVEILLLPTEGPVLDIVSKGIPAPAVQKAAEALAAAGFIPTGSTEAKIARTASVVYAAKGQEAMAKKIAAAIPGGASVDKLTWKSDADVVVALGDSAAQ